MRITTALKTAALLFSLIGVIIFGIGAASTVWPRTPFVLDQESLEHVTVTHLTKGGRLSNTSLNTETAHYRYSVGGHEYHSSLICFCLPLGGKEQAVVRSAKSAAYLSLWPRLAVLETGPDIFLAALFFLLALISYMANASLPDLLGRDV